jgi:hypothetical protein
MISSVGTHRKEEVMNTNAQTASPTVLSTYRVSAERRFAADAPEQIDFVITAESGKTAWVEARRLTRMGAKVKTSDGDDLDIAAGLYTVRNVTATERRDRKPKVITLDSFLEAAKVESIPLSKKLLDLVARLQQPSAPTSDTPKTEQQNTEAA